MTRYVAATLLLLGAAGVCAGRSESQSVADAAKHNRKAKKAVLVLSDENGASFGGVVSVVGSEPVKTAASSAASSQKAAVPSSQAAPSNSGPQVAELKKKLAADKGELAGWKQSAKYYEDLLATETNDFRRQTYASALANDRANVERSQQKINEVESQLAATAEKQASSSSAASDTRPKDNSSPGSKQQ